MAMQSALEDRILVRKTLEGDKQSFDMLVIKYQPRLLKLINQSISDVSLSQDLCQEAFTKAYVSLHTFRGRSAFYTWLYRITVNSVINFNKERRRQPMSVELKTEYPTFIPSRIKFKDYGSPEHWLECDEMQDSMEVGFNELPKELRDSLILREIEGLSYDEIADMMHCPLGTVRSRISRARSVMDEYIKTYLE